MVLRYQFLAVHNVKSSWSTEAIVCTISKIDQDVVWSCSICADKFRDKGTSESTKQGFNTFEDIRQAYMVEEIAESHMPKQ
jgi:hypothetical protein